MAHYFSNGIRIFCLLFLAQERLESYALWQSRHLERLSTQAPCLIRSTAMQFHEDFQQFAALGVLAKKIPEPSRGRWIPQGTRCFPVVTPKLEVCVYVFVLVFIKYTHTHLSSLLSQPFIFHSSHSLSPTQRSVALLYCTIYYSNTISYQRSSQNSGRGRALSSFPGSSGRAGEQHPDSSGFRHPGLAKFTFVRYSTCLCDRFADMVECVRVSVGEGGGGKPARTLDVIYESSVRYSPPFAIESFSV